MTAKNYDEGIEVEKLVATLINASHVSTLENYDVLTLKNHKVEVKSFYFFTGWKKRLGKIKININTHENKSCDYYLFVGKSHQGRFIRFVLILTWDEVDCLIKKLKKKPHALKCGVSVFEFSWMQLLNTSVHRKNNHFQKV